MGVTVTTKSAGGRTRKKAASGTAGGFRRKPPVYKLVFTDPELAGLEVRARSIDLAEMLNVGRLEALPTLTDEDLTELVGHFAEALVSWNVELPERGREKDEDAPWEPIPPTMEGLRRLDYPFLRAIMMAWTEAIAGVSAPLPSGSPSGGPSLEQSIPMEPLSESRAS